MFQTVFGTVGTQTTSAIVLTASADGYFSARNALDLGIRRCEALAAYRNHCRMRMAFPGLVFVHTVPASATKHGNPSPEQDVVFACTRWRHGDRATDATVERCVRAISKEIEDRGRGSVSCGNLGGETDNFRSLMQQHSDRNPGRAWYLVLPAPKSRMTYREHLEKNKDTSARQGAR